uniref:Sugar phosphate transporter domain-containing protein n=1 Tax=Acrobeloides nanus TaxID=290746 RepID=A0A914D4C4_9BILA
MISKWMDEVEVDMKKFNHPYFQAACMFIGECLCLIAYFIEIWIQKRIDLRQRVMFKTTEIALARPEEPKLSKLNPFIFLPPACCDIIASSLSYVSLNLTSASNASMLRGAILLFTGLLSVLFLKMRFPAYKWLGIGFVSLGLIVVGVTDMLFDHDPTHNVNGIIIGNFLCILAQLIQSIQIVLEQKFLQHDDVPPLLAVGLEGIFGLTIISILMVPMYFIHVAAIFSDNPDGRLEDVFYAFYQMSQKPELVACVVLTIFNIAILNFASLAFTKRFSGATRLVLSSISTLSIWALSMPIFHEEFMPLKILGFAFLIIGMLVYNDTFFGPKFRSKIMPRMIDTHPCTLCCISFCRADLETNEESRLLNDQGA